MKNSVLDALVESKDIKSYTFKIFDEDGNEQSIMKGNRNTEELTITFNSGKTLIVSTFCSGSAENTSLFISGDFTLKNV